jgi:hypothetical protein
MRYLGPQEHREKLISGLPEITEEELWALLSRYKQEIKTKILAVPVTMKYSKLVRPGDIILYSIHPLIPWQR